VNPSKDLAKRLVREDEGQDLIEYALLATFVSLAATAGVMMLGPTLMGWYETLSHRADSAASTAAS